ncbi:MAG TPA: chemotaxis protein CheW [Nocardioides sp.]|uniref:chemotaxis protein CheW n=1 Tax=uncultured Nocardioides sp. TaxID=198441 RepID=UPI000EEA4788|nr:chemotaxis protein CheW [uncultured Nocardioides sp.]HCB03992.1 chemotaxis protein CheA [Nocardioides sp.]HRD61722.1 chemotaxis protein CheW [Nocardioides sp.]HRI95371.1 chemotaxis protein CheW [Nocardioides sp.]
MHDTGLDDIVQEFLIESHENLDQLDRDLVALEQQPESRELLASVFRTIHTIKGTSGFLAFHKLEAVTHVGENLLARLRDGQLSLTSAITDVLLSMVDTVRELLASIEADGTEGDADVEELVVAIAAVLEGVPRTSTRPEVEVEVEVEVIEPFPAESRRTVADASIRVDVDLLDALMRLVGELVLTRNQIAREAGQAPGSELAGAAQRLNLIAGELHEGVMKTRMQPIDHLWSKLPRVVRDLGATCGKEVNLTMVGRETELDRSLLESVKDPLTHLVRNAVDHGLEAPAARVAAGKPAAGTLTLRAYHEGGQVVVEVCDDGAGIDPARIAGAAVAQGLCTRAAADAMSRADQLQLIFAPGFSTATTLTHVSGRGVGMDVVRTNIEAIGGTIEIESVLGRGTTCRLRIPLTLAIVPALTVECAGDRYAVPQVNVLELVALDADRALVEFEEVNGAPVHLLRGVPIPLVNLAEFLQIGSGRPDGQLLFAVLQAEGRRFGLVIDRVLNTEEIVVKPLSPRLKTLGTFSGATILGDGRVALILDVQSLARRALPAEPLERTGAQAAEETQEAPDRVSLLLATVGGGRRVAIPLSSVTRIEHLPATAVEVVGSREVVHYRGAILPLLRLGGDSAAPSELPSDVLSVVVYTAGARSVVIAVDEIVDIVEADAEVPGDLDVRGAILAADARFYELEDAL